MLSHWIIAPVVLPAVLAPLIVLAFRRDLTLQRVFSTAGTIALLVLALSLLLASARGPELYRLGDWPAPFGIVLMLDRLSALMLVLTAGLALVVQLYAMGTGWDTRGKHFHALLQFQLMGLNGAFLTADAFNLFVFFEVLLIASYALMIHGAGGDRLRAGVQYVAFNLLGSSLFLIALALLYSVTGTLNMADLAVRIAAIPEGDMALIRVGAVLLMLVFAIKGALVPLQFWLPGTYANAPGPVAALFAIMTKVGAYAMIRMGTLVFPPAVAATGQRYTFDMGSGQYKKEIARARTFGMTADIELMRSRGLTLGGNMDNAIVVDDYKVLNSDGLRYDDEFVKHKILDAIGDMQVAGYPLLAAYTSFKGGHALNNLLLRELLKDEMAFEYVTFERDQDAPQRFAELAPAWTVAA